MEPRPHDGDIMQLTQKELQLVNNYLIAQRGQDPRQRRLARIEEQRRADQAAQERRRKCQLVLACLKEVITPLGPACSTVDILIELSDSRRTSENFDALRTEYKAATEQRMYENKELRAVLEEQLGGGNFKIVGTHTAYYKSIELAEKRIEQTCDNTSTEQPQTGTKTPAECWAFRPRWTAVFRELMPASACDPDRNVHLPLWSRA